MIGLLLRLVIAAFGLWLSAQVIPGIEVRSLEALALAALVLGIANAVVRPIVVVLTLPLTILTLGLFLLVINAGMIWLVSVFIHGFVVHGFVPAVECAILTGITGWIGSAFIGRHGRFERF